MWLGVWYIDKVRSVMTYLNPKLSHWPAVDVPIICAHASPWRSTWWGGHFLVHGGTTHDGPYWQRVDDKHAKIFITSEAFDTTIQWQLKHDEQACIHVSLVQFLFVKEITKLWNLIWYHILGFKCQRTNERRFAAGSSECSNRLLRQRGNRLRTHITSAFTFTYNTTFTLPKFLLVGSPKWKNGYNTGLMKLQ